MLRRNLLLALGLLALVSGAALSVLWLRQQTATVGSGGSAPARVSILVAARPIAAGAMLRPDDIGSTDIQASDMQATYIAHSAAAETEYAGALARRDFRAGDPLAADGLLKSSDRSFLSAVLTPGLRAVTLAVEAAQTASGLVIPGDHVDVVLTQSLGDAASDPGRRAVAETVLRDVRVVAVEQSLTQAAKPVGSDSRFAQELRVPRTITLEVSEADAQKLLVAIQLGKVDLAVRALAVNAANPNAQPLPPTWAADVSAASQAMGTRAAKPAPVAQPVSAAAAPPVQTHSTLEVMHGSKIEVR